MAFPLAGVTVSHLHPTVADVVIMITEESHYFNGGSMSRINVINKIHTLHRICTFRHH